MHIYIYIYIYIYVSPPTLRQLDTLQGDSLGHLSKTWFLQKWRITTTTTTTSTTTTTTTTTDK